MQKKEKKKGVLRFAFLRMESFFLKYQKTVNFLAIFFDLQNCRQKARPDPILCITLFYATN